jgi:hypothetical protein
LKIITRNTNWKTAFLYAFLKEQEERKRVVVVLKDSA